MRVRTDDGRATELAWTVYEEWLAGRIREVLPGGVLAIALAPEVVQDHLVPTIDVYVETTGALLASATGNSVLARRFQMTRRVERTLDRDWRRAVSDRRGVVLWELEVSGDGAPKTVAAKVARVLSDGYGVPHPVWLRTDVDDDALQPPDWRAVHRGARES